MSPKPRHSELVAVQVLREQQWAYARRLEHLSYRDIRRLAVAPPDEGGLGYDISEQGLKGLVKGYLESMREVLAPERDELIAREAAMLDLATRHAVASLRRAEDAREFDPTGLDALLKVSDRRRKLYGLDAPTEARVEVHAYDGATAELNAMLAEAGIEVLHD